MMRGRRPGRVSVSVAQPAVNVLVCALSHFTGFCAPARLTRTHRACMSATALLPAAATQCGCTPRAAPRVRCAAARSVLPGRRGVLTVGLSTAAAAGVTAVVGLAAVGVARAAMSSGDVSLITRRGMAKFIKACTRAWWGATHALTAHVLVAERG